MLLGKTQQEIAAVFKLSHNRISEILNLDENASNIETDNTSKDKRSKLSSDEEVSVALLAIKGEKHPDTVKELCAKDNDTWREMKRSFIEENPTIVGVSEFALRPLINEQDSDIRANTLQKIRSGVSKGQPMGAENRGNIALS